jgi:ADP-ribose pyrophosphatase
MEKWIRSEEIYKGDILSLQVGDVKLENGEVFRREVIRHNGGVAIVPVINNSIFLIRQFRIAIERDILELPAGKLEIGESPEACAHRELGEEIGYRAGKMIFATSFYTSIKTSQTASRPG